MCERNSQDGRKAYNHKTFILGTGNILRRDDGVGIHVINRLKDLDLPPNVTLLDGGTAGFDLLHYLQDINKLIVIDAILTGEKPGTIHVFSVDTETRRHGVNSPFHRFTASPLHHQIGLMETIEIANRLWGGIETVIIGVVPKDYLNYGIELTPEVNNAIEHVINICMSLLSLKA